MIRNQISKLQIKIQKYIIPNRINSIESFCIFNCRFDFCIFIFDFRF